MSNVIVINRGLEERRSATGRMRRTIRIDAEPMVINMDPKALGKPGADAIANHYREKVRGIAATASATTVKARKAAAKAFSEGKSWAMKRYAGGRIGALPPNQSDRLFNDSGRFADSIVANASNDNAWRINVAANRLDDKTAGPAGVERIWNRLVQLVPEFANVGLLFEGNAIARQTLKRVSEERIKIGKRAMTQFEKFSALFLRSA
jgi:hypothetical protein